MQERHDLEELDRLHIGEDGLFHEPVTSSLPIVAEMELLTRVHGSYEFERIERLPAGVHLLEHEAYGSAGGVLAKRNDRNVIIGEVVDDLNRKLVDQAMWSWRASMSFSTQVSAACIQS